MDRSRRQVLVELAAAFGAVVVGATALGRLPFGRKRARGAAAGVSGKTAGARARVRPAPFSVKRHG